jgi:hypothetical protein
MDRLLIATLAVLGVLWNVDLGARVYVDAIMWVLIAAFMFTMGARFDDLLRRWELQPRWRKVAPTESEAETLCLSETSIS